METQNEGLENKDRVAKLIFFGVFVLLIYGSVSASRMFISAKKPNVWGAWINANELSVWIPDPNDYL